MRSFILKLNITLIFLLNISFILKAEKIWGTGSTSNPVCLEILGIAMDSGNKPIDGVEVRLFRENNELEWTEITSVVYHEHSFIFKLEANEYYTIEISKPGFVTRSVGISTRIPDNISLKQLFRYEFEVELFREKKVSDDYYLDFPVALISYDSKRDVFDNNSAYTKHIKSMIRTTIDEASSKTINTKK
jgi:hypothetical protein